MNDRDFLEVDLGALDQEWLLQPRLMGEWMDKLADAKAEHSSAEANAKVVWAETALEVRKDPGSFGLDKITEKLVEQVADSHPDVIAAQQAAIDAKHVVDVLSGVTRSLEHKKHALQDLVELQGRDYFSSPKASSEEAKNTEKRIARRRSGTKPVKKKKTSKKS